MQQGNHFMAYQHIQVGNHFKESVQAVFKAYTALGQFFLAGQNSPKEQTSGGCI